MRRLALAALAFLALAAPARAEVPLAPCTLPQAVRAACGTVVVPENRADPASRRISLRVAVVRAQRRPPAGALFYLAGGPGGAASEDAPYSLEHFAQVNRTRDLVLLDQRGTGGSNRLTCRRPATAPADPRAWVDQCLASIAGDPRYYTSREFADDVEDVRVALGYGKIDLYGVSYGGTSGQILLRRHPESIRSAVLDGATLLDVPILEEWARSAQRAVDVVSKHCLRDRACRRAFPRFRAELPVVLARLRTRPVSGMTSDEAAEAIRTLSLQPESATEIPFLVHSAFRGRYGPLLATWRAVERAEAAAGDVVVMKWSIVCHEGWARREPAEVARRSAGSYFEHAWVAATPPWLEQCALVPRPDEPEDATAVSTDVPVLFLAGELDAQDPPPAVRGATATMPNARVVVVPTAGHGSLRHGCTPQLVATFVARGSAAALDTSCLRKLRFPPFRIA